MEWLALAGAQAEARIPMVCVTTRRMSKDSNPESADTKDAWRGNSRTGGSEPGNGWQSIRQHAFAPQEPGAPGKLQAGKGEASRGAGRPETFQHDPECKRYDREPGNECSSKIGVEPGDTGVGLGYSRAIP